MQSKHPKHPDLPQIEILRGRIVIGSGGNDSAAMALARRRESTDDLLASNPLFLVGSTNDVRMHR